VYLISAAAIVLLLTPELEGLVVESRKGADWRTLDSVRAAVDALRPGVVLNLTYGSLSAQDSVRLSGRLFTISYGNGTFSLPSRWLLPNETLHASVPHLLWLEGGKVVVASPG